MDLRVRSRKTRWTRRSILRELIRTESYTVRGGQVLFAVDKETFSADAVQARRASEWNGSALRLRIRLVSIAAACSITRVGQISAILGPFSARYSGEEGLGMREQSAHRDSFRLGPSPPSPSPRSTGARGDKSPVVAKRLRPPACHFGSPCRQPRQGPAKTHGMRSLAFQEFPRFSRGPAIGTRLAHVSNHV